MAIVPERLGKMAGLQMLLLCLVISTFPSVVHGYIEGLYCGTENCYELLGITRRDEDQSRNEINKAYRSLARKWHPDRHKTKKAKEEAHEMFMKIANAYEILKDEEARNDYNYMLDNPEEYYAHYYRYYRRRVAPRVDVRLVVAVCITAISLIQEKQFECDACDYAVENHRWNTVECLYFMLNGPVSFVERHCEDRRTPNH
ncbi:hypothetical protein LSAT2_000751 [Lamellibrachia satsuma]|nr:hypothetical protein LSAT2_000751 [Lamellibrachia satsuma]